MRLRLAIPVQFGDRSLGSGYRQHQYVGTLPIPLFVMGEFIGITPRKYHPRTSPVIPAGVRRWGAHVC